MTFTLPDASRNAAVNAVVDLIDAGAGAGSMEFKTAASAVAGTNEVATITFQDPAFDNAAAGTAAALGVPLQDSSATGSGSPVTDGTLFDSDGNNRGQFNVGTSGQDVNLSSVDIAATDVVTITSLTITQPAS